MKFIVISHAFKQLNKFFYLWLHKKLINTDQHIGQRIGFSTQNNTILCNQVRTKILSALLKMGDIDI